MNDDQRTNSNQANELVEEVWGELRVIAAGYLRKERIGHTLEPTALVNAAWIRMADQQRAKWKDSTHFRAMASIVMRRVLVDHARMRQAKKRGADHERITLCGIDDQRSAMPVDAIMLDEALNRLESMNLRQAKIVELRFFGGLTNIQIASHTGVSERTVQREWLTARAWLFNELAT